MTAFIDTMNSAPPELIGLLMLVLSYGGVLVLMRLFGIYGLITFIIVALLGANFQVLKVVQFSMLSHPVALGTILFSTTYTAIDIINDRYGPKMARKVIWIGFAAMVAHNAFMITTLSYAPIDAVPGDAENAFYLETENALRHIMLPQVGLLAAGLLSYLASEHLDVTLFSWLKGTTGGKKLWLRNVGSSLIAALFDNVVFSILAWKLFTANPVSWEALIFTYILGTFYIRMLISVLDIPLVYLARKIPLADAPGTAAKEEASA